MSALLDWTGSVWVCVRACVQLYSVSPPLHIHTDTFVLFPFICSFCSTSPPLILPSPQTRSSLPLSSAHPSLYHSFIPPSLFSLQFRILPPRYWSPNLLSDPPAGTVLNKYTVICCFSALFLGLSSKQNLFSWIFATFCSGSKNNVCFVDI